LNRSLRLLVATAALCAAMTSPAFAAGSGDATVKITGASQADALKRGIEVAVTGDSKRVPVTLESKSFDHSKLRPAAPHQRVLLGDDGKATVTLELTSNARKKFTSCEARTLRASVPGDSDRADLKRDTSECEPKPVDLSAADDCDFIGAQEDSLCLLPFPDNYYTVRDEDTRTGRRIDLHTAGMPKNEEGVPIDAGPYNLNDGFSPGQSIVVKVPGLETQAAMDETNAVPLNRLSEYARKGAPIVVIDAKTGKRWPIWAEIDSKAEDASRAAVLIHPAKNFDAGHRYIVAMRKLKDENGDLLDAPEGFRYYRDDLPSKQGQVNSRRDHYESVFRKLRKADVKRSNLYMAWDFTVASDENIAGRMLHIRDNAFAALGDTNLSDLTVQGDSPKFKVLSVDNYSSAQEADMGRRVQGTFTVPCYLAPDCEAASPGGRFDLDANGKPKRTGNYTANFNCMIPRAAVDAPAQPVRPSLYGHGLLGSANEATSGPQQTLGNDHGFIFCATDEIGLSSSDIPNAFAILHDLGKFPELADRLQQGMLDELYLGRLMIHPDGFASSGAFHVDGTTGSPSIINPQRLYYNGNSQGGIEGGGLTAVAPDFTRASLGVTGMNYSVLLNRSVDFDKYAELGLEPAYTDELEQPLALALIQMLWDRGEANGYAHRMTDNPLPDTPAHEVLMNVGFGDHQVSTFTADTEARTIGAQVHFPVVYPDRWPNMEIAWGIPRIAFDGPGDSYTGSALVYWDSGPVRDDPNSADPADVLGTPPPPVENQPPREGKDPHELPRRTPEEQQMVSDFLQPNAQSHITDTCGGGPCYDFTFNGP
jgi:hypothetical protein